MQTQSHEHRLYTGTFQCIRTIVAKESISGLYRGLSSPMAGVALVNAVVFGVYGNILKRSKNPNSLQTHFVAGTTAGFIQSLITSPMELTKTIMQMQSNHISGPRFHGPLECMRYINRKDGIRGLYRGFGITAVRDVPGFASYFVLYEAMMRTSTAPSAFHTLMAGGLAGVCSWILTLPMDVVKTRLQADATAKMSRYAGIVDCVKQSYRAEGLSFLTHGMSSTLIRAFLMNSVCFYVVAYTMRVFDENRIEVDVGIADPMAVASAKKDNVTIHHPLPTHMSNANQFGIAQTMQYMSALSDAIIDNETMAADDEDPYQNFQTGGDQLEAGYYYSCMDTWTVDAEIQ